MTILRWAGLTLAALAGALAGLATNHRDRPRQRRVPPRPAQQKASITILTSNGKRTHTRKP